MSTPWVMGRTTLCVLHDPWIMQWYIYPMGHGLCNSMHIPWVMDHTMAQLVCVLPWVMGHTIVCIPHDPWIMQQYAYPMGHRSYSG